MLEIQLSVKVVTLVNKNVAVCLHKQPPAAP
jgi:hypothetical protein